MGSFIATRAGPRAATGGMAATVASCVSWRMSTDLAAGMGDSGAAASCGAFASSAAAGCRRPCTGEGCCASSSVLLVVGAGSGRDRLLAEAILEGVVVLDTRRGPSGAGGARSAKKSSSSMALGPTTAGGSAVFVERASAGKGSASAAVDAETSEVSPARAHMLSMLLHKTRQNDDSQRHPSVVFRTGMMYRRVGRVLLSACDLAPGGLRKAATSAAGAVRSKAAYHVPFAHLL